jgi:hypothetical protein
MAKKLTAREFRVGRKLSCLLKAMRPAAGAAARELTAIVGQGGCCMTTVHQKIRAENGVTATAATPVEPVNRH